MRIEFNPGMGALGGCSGAPLSTQQVYGLARDAGFSDDNARSVVAIAMRESGLNPNCFADHVAGSTEASFGLMQINMSGTLGTSRLISLGLSDASQLLNPVTNILSAYRLSGGSNFSPWHIDSDTAQVRQPDGSLKTVNLGYRTKYLANLASLPSDLESNYYAGRQSDLTTDTVVTDLPTINTPPIDGSFDLSTLAVPAGIGLLLWLWLR